jgi:hypothetical protein
VADLEGRGHQQREALASGELAEVKTAIVAAWLAAELAHLPGSRAPGETREEYVERAGQIAAALAEEATPYANGTGWTSTELAAAGAVIWYSETLLDKRIQAGEQHPVWNQDHGLARCGMQLHASGIVPQDVWERLVGQGSDPVHLCAQYGLRVVVAQARQCGVFLGVRADRNRVAKTFASYASGGRCTPTDRDWQRADLWLKMMAKRPDHSKATLPGYRRVGPAEVPMDVKLQADGIVGMLVWPSPKESRVHVGDTFTPTDAKLASYKLVVEKHAEGKVGVSVFVKE